MNTNFSFKIEVSKKNIDHLGHVNNIVYLTWVLTAAEKHWDYLSNTELNEKYVWVVLRHEIDYLGQAIFGDELIVKTWVETCSGVKSDRIVEIYKNDKLLTKAKTTWCLLDKKSMRPNRIPSEIKRRFGFE